MEQIILTPQQQKFLDTFTNSALTEHFYLTGGTALAAYYLHHRTSDDLDFFSDAKVDLPAVTAFISKMKTILHAKEPRYERLYDRNIFYIPGSPELKAEFTCYPFPRLAPLVHHGDLKVDSLLDIGVNKLFTIFDRNEPKDFIDLFFLLQKFSLHELTQNMQKKFAFSVSPFTLGTELLKVRHLPAFPKLLNPISEQEIVHFFEKKARTLSPQILE